ncbi:MAG: serine/threonine protein kinase [ANME-2 cluster archaeon]|nr:serine/threonine protein kinase [ANME-2 cluster archaeon]MBC2707736.1 serine/threonine protein kinase [ANME-2 cluster archaeon]MBC2747378.1 serine/threonine protein kinase [ANME-2 cluster archaeon]
MLEDISSVFMSLEPRHFRVLTGIEVGMKYHEWVPVEEVSRYTKLDMGQLHYILKDLGHKGLLQRQTVPYEGYRIYFEGYDLLALNALVKRESLSAIGEELGVGKESVVYEGLREMVGGLGQQPVILKFHRQGRTSFKQVKRKREHLDGLQHFSWIYAARLAAKREFEVMQRLYPEVSVPEPVDQNRNVIVMAIAEGGELSKTRVVDPGWYRDKILEQVRAAYVKGVVHGDLSEYNIFVSDEGVTLIDWPQYVEVGDERAGELLERDVGNVLAFFKRKYGVERDVGEVMSAELSHLPASSFWQ